MIDQTASAVQAPWPLEITGPEEFSASLKEIFRSFAPPGEPLPRLNVTIDDRVEWMSGEIEGLETWRNPLPSTQRLSVALGYCVAAFTMALRRHIFVHAGAVALDGEGWILVGRSGSGKTSIVARLLHRGAFYLSDEVALLDAAAGHVTPFALPMAIKPWTARALPRLPEGRDVAWDGQVQFRLPQRLQGSPVPVAGIILLNGRRGRRRLTPISAGRMLVALSSQTTSLNRRERLEEAFIGFGRLVRSSRCFVLEGPNPAACADLLYRSARNREAADQRGAEADRGR